MTTQDNMKEAAEEARKEFNTRFTTEDANTLDALGAWWERWFQTAGHKRLAYILMHKKMKDE